MVQITQCCYCISLRTGALIIGAVHLIWSAIALGGMTKITMDVFSNDFHVLIQVIFALLTFFCAVQIILDVQVLLIIAAKKVVASCVPYWMVGKTIVLVLCSTTFAISIQVNYKAFAADISLAIPLLATYFTHFAVSIYILVILHCFYKSIKDLKLSDDKDFLTSTPQTSQYVKQKAGEFAY